MTDSVFSQETPVTQPVVTPAVTQAAPTPAVAPVVDPSTMFADQLASIKNPEGTQKYGSVEDALKGATHAQDYILQLQTQLAEAQTAATKSSSMTDVMEALKQSQVPAEIPAATGLGEEDASKLFTKMYADQQTHASNQANELDVSKSLMEQYGDKAKEILTSRATELGVTVDYIKEVSRMSPAAAKTMLGLSTKTTPGFTTSTQLNTQALQQGDVTPAPRAFKMVGHGSNDLMNEWKRCRT
jgi:hypothetical protein